MPLGQAYPVGRTSRPRGWLLEQAVLAVLLAGQVLLVDSIKCLTGVAPSPRSSDMTKFAHLAKMELDRKSVQLGSPKLVPLLKCDQKSHVGPSPGP